MSPSCCCYITELLLQRGDSSTPLHQSEEFELPDFRSDHMGLSEDTHQMINLSPEGRVSPY